MECPECNKPITNRKWCNQCNAKRFQQDFPNWTSGNKYIDNFIQETQLNAQNCFQILEWIPYNRLTNINYLAKGSFSTVYNAIWLDGRIGKWDNDKKQWKRYCDEKDGKVVIKSLDNSSNINDEFLNEWKMHFKCQGSYAIVRLFGFTQNPNNSDYMIVMDYVRDGSLRNSLKNGNYDWNDILNTLRHIIRGLDAIHKSKLVHCDFHDGNILCDKNGSNYICNFGLCKPIDYFKSNNDIYGVMPYVAPEVLRGKPFTAASDIYSFAMIMWELTSGVPPFDDRAHDFHLSLSICKGERPKIIENTPQCYVDLMKKCWHSDSLQRPTASELKIIIENWFSEFNCVSKKSKKIEKIEDKQLREDIEEFIKTDNVLKERQDNPTTSNSKAVITESHPQLLDFAKKLNEALKDPEIEIQSVEEN